MVNGRALQESYGLGIIATFRQGVLAANNGRGLAWGNYAVAYTAQEVGFGKKDGGM